METQSATQPRISDYIRPLTSRWWLILVAVVVATGGVYAYYARKPNVYTASTLVFYRDPGDPVTGLPSPQSTDRTVQNEASLLSSRGNAAAVAKRIGFHGSPQDLLNTVSISSKTGEDFVQITAKAGGAKEAANIANAFGSQFVSSLNGAYVSRIQGLLKLSQAQLAQTASGPATDVQRANLLSQINRLQLDAKFPNKPAQQINPALPPGGPSSPKPLRNALFALLLSLVGAIAVAYGLERFDRRLRNPEDLESAYETPVLAVLPHTDEPAPIAGELPALSRDFREPFRVLRTNVELAAVDTPPQTIVISSAMPGEGKSTVVRNLALTFHETGKRVVVVDLDLRHPAQARMFGVGAAPGMTEVLRHNAELDDVILDIATATPDLEELFQTGVAETHATNGKNGHNGVRAPGIALILCGAPPANPPAVLASKRVVEVLDDLRQRYDIVLIDSAPVLAVTDTVPLLRYADASLFVGRLGVTTRDTAKRLTEFLSRVPDMNLFGAVANDLSRLEAGAYGYGYYGYGYGYGEDDKSKGRGRRKADEAEPRKQTV
jgi:Mrp family chromosome partitioning ATPase/capsular polysaccharide biosynthesis protein